MTTCCPPNPCCIGTVVKAPEDVLQIAVDMSDWVASGGTILTGSTTVSVYDVTNDAPAPAPPAGVGVSGALEVGQGPDGLQSQLLIGIEGGTNGTTYRLDVIAEVRSCTGFTERKKFCILVQVADNA